MRNGLVAVVAPEEDRTRESTKSAPPNRAICAARRGQALRPDSAAAACGDRVCVRRR